MTSKVHLQNIYTKAGHKVRLTELFAARFLFNIYERAHN
jgi:hypothetical protein